MLKNYYLKFKNLLKSRPKIPKKRLEEFLCASKILFDISSYKCENIDECFCSRHKKGHVKKKSLLIEQRTTRRMVIGTIDMVTTNKITNTLKRKMISQKLQFQRYKIKKRELNVSTSSVSSHQDSDDVFLPQSQASTWVSPVD
ncbi:hypothetical protein AVEN_159083-1 [Araneus ventricosus]|uniref:Uncharacterized protein n=1 Tax=Araneus ventricosus TaxID=182803 RepID=A0A4Y2BAY0_ARAVE|nr:hypothetical protein AVEN_159083-1 [Araneus ventricosus]